jgi:probable rRNA maturation factor
MINIESTHTFQKDLVERAVKAALIHQLQSLDCDLTIVLTDDAQLRELNHDYLGIDAATDVLSFPASESDGSEIDPETGARYMGDILISMPYAARSAKKAGHPLASEVQLLVVHGVLHLLGHDHAEADEKKRMWQAQSQILDQLGLGDIKIREE